MNVSRIFIERPIGTALLAVGLFLSAQSPTFSCPSRACRHVEFPTCAGQATRPGADPETMAASVASRSSAASARSPASPR